MDWNIQLMRPQKLSASMEEVRYTANVYRELQGVYREIGVRGFQIHWDCMLPAIPVILKSPHSDFHCNNCREFDFTGILQRIPALDVGKPFNNLIFGDITAKLAGICL